MFKFLLYIVGKYQSPNPVEVLDVNSSKQNVSVDIKLNSWVCPAPLIEVHAAYNRNKVNIRRVLR